MNKLIGLARDSEDGHLQGSAIEILVESELPGFHAAALPKCLGDNARAQSGFFPLDDFCKSLSDARHLDFPALWSALSEVPGIDDLQEERLKVYQETNDPHPTRIFDLDSSVWFRNLITERISVDRYHATYVGSYNFAEVCFDLLTSSEFTFLF